MKVTAIKNIIKTISFGTDDKPAIVRQNENSGVQKQNLNFEKKITADVVEISTKEQKKGFFQKAADFYRQARETSESVPYSVHVPYYWA